VFYVCDIYEICNDVPAGLINQNFGSRPIATTFFPFGVEIYQLFNLGVRASDKLKESRMLKLELY
jgi:hypothetical protein